MPVSTLFRPLRRSIRRSPTAYRFYLSAFVGAEHLEYNPDARMPTAATELHLTGFQRSANTFARFLTAEAFPDRHVATHMHVVASLRQARALGTPTVVLVRDPADVLASFMTMHRSDSDPADVLDEAIDDYVEYYRFAVDEMEAAFLAFGTVVGQPERAIELLADHLGWETPPGVPLEEVVRRARAEFADVESRFEAHQTTLPNADKTKANKTYYATIRAHPRFAEAEGAFAEASSTVLSR